MVFQVNKWKIYASFSKSCSDVDMAWCHIVLGDLFVPIIINYMFRDCSWLPWNYTYFLYAAHWIKTTCAYTLFCSNYSRFTLFFRTATYILVLSRVIFTIKYWVVISEHQQSLQKISKLVSTSVISKVITSLIKRNGHLIISHEKLIQNGT